MKLSALILLVAMTGCATLQNLPCVVAVECIGENCEKVEKAQVVMGLAATFAEAVGLIEPRCPAGD